MVLRNGRRHAQCKGVQLNDTTRKFPRTLREAFGMSPEDAVAIHVYRVPLRRRILYALIRYGWVVLFLAVIASSCIGS